MTDLGHWNPFTDETGVRKWYGSFPASIDDELRNYMPHDADFNPLDAGRFKQVRAAAFAMADASVARLNLPDHNPEHFEEVRRNGLALFDAYFGKKAKTTFLAVRQAYEIALYCHDCYHCGSTFRRNAVRPGAVHLPSLGTNISVEWVSALEMVRFGQQWQLPLPMIVFMVCVILATTFGGKVAHSRGIKGIPIVVPTHLISCMTRVADAQVQSTFLKTMQKSMNVNVGEIPATGQVHTYHELITAAFNFINGYLIGSYQQLDKAAGRSLTEQLGWKKTTNQYVAQLQQLLNKNDSRLEATIRAMLLKQYNVSE